MHLIDTETGKVTTFRVKLQGPNDDKARALVAGIVFRSDDQAIAFSKLQVWSQDINKPVALPAYVDASSSYLLRAGPDTGQQLGVFFAGAHAQHQLEMPPARTWTDLALTLNKTPKTFNVQ